MALHSSKGILAIGGLNSTTTTETITVVGVITPRTMLQYDDLYIFNGSFGQDSDTMKASLYYSNMSHFALGPSPSLTLPYLDGCSIVNSTGQVTSVEFHEGDCSATPWKLCLTAKHDYYDHILQSRRVFNMIYMFGHITPQTIEWKHFHCGACLCLNGNLVGKDSKTGCFIVDISLINYLTL
ncbi:hypothetical protein DFH28DRAFT_878092 [Melampsora americana]|nr:hypothetical protein DFH28DRAFT_878092 [Melampsora americana]